MNASATNFPAIAMLMFATGIGIPVLATWSGGVGQALGSPAAATLVIFAVGLVLSGVVLAVAGVPAAPAFGRVPVYFYSAAALMVFYILSITWAGPRIGIGNAVFFVLLGQLVAAAAMAIPGMSSWAALTNQASYALGGR